MNDDITHRQFFGDTERDFCLPAHLVLELERKAGSGIGGMYRRMVAVDFSSTDVVEIIRLGLIGGGTDPEQAAALVAAYVDPLPLSAAYTLAMEIMDARMVGKQPVQIIAPETEIAPDAE